MRHFRMFVRPGGEGLANGLTNPNEASQTEKSIKKRPYIMPQKDLRILWNYRNIMINSACTNGESDGSKHCGGDFGLGGTSLSESFCFHVVHYSYSDPPSV